MVYHDLVSARNRNDSLYECRSNVRTTLTKQQQEISTNAQKNTLSYAQAMTGVPADATSNNNRITQLATSFIDFKNIFSQLLNQNSMTLSLLITVINKLTE
jgi:hypothetical protein